MTATTGTQGTAGTIWPWPLFKAYEEAVRKNDWEKGGLKEKAVFEMAFAKMLEAWGKHARFSFPTGCKVPYSQYYELLRYGDGRNLWVGLGQAGVVRMSLIWADCDEEDRKMMWLDEFFETKARWVFGTCLEYGFSVKMMQFCVNQLALEAGCDDGAYLRSLEFDASPMRIPLEAMSKEDAEKMLADLKKLEVKK